MALTLEKLQRLQAVQATNFFQGDRARWVTAARRAYNYVKEGFGGQDVRIDDCVTPLVAVVEIDAAYRNFLNGKKLRQKYWIPDFAEYVLDQTWDEITEEEEE
jgi:hypothetical protein